MPLTITQAAAYITPRAPRATVSSYLSDLRNGNRDSAKLLDTDIRDFCRDGTASNSISHLLDIIYLSLQSEAFDYAFAIAFKSI